MRSSWRSGFLRRLVCLRELVSTMENEHLVDMRLLTSSLVVPFTCHEEGLSIRGALSFGHVDQRAETVAIVGTDCTLSDHILHGIWGVLSARSDRGERE